MVAVTTVGPVVSGFSVAPMLPASLDRPTMVGGGPMRNMDLRAAQESPIAPNPLPAHDNDTKDAVAHGPDATAVDIWQSQPSPAVAFFLGACGCVLLAVFCLHLIRCCRWVRTVGFKRAWAETRLRRAFGWCILLDSLVAAYFATVRFYTEDPSKKTMYTFHCFTPTLCVLLNVCFAAQVPLPAHRTALGQLK